MARKRILAQLLQDETGASTVEYALILGMIVLAMFAALSGVATVTVDMWDNMANTSSEAINGG
ncbi:Flp family type IVb pilin [Novosphingobium endophyticum]|nr:Flp family type IVb pilin [Novosphingobium endophyticum]